MKENAEKLRALDKAELDKQLRDSGEQMFRLRFQLSMGQNEGINKLRMLRKEKARMLTVLRERQLIETPKPITLRALHIFLHECGHAYLHTGKERPKHRVEFEAETWAFKKMRDALIEPHPTSIERAKKYVRRKINQAVKRGAKWIDVEAAQWSEYENA